MSMDGKRFAVGLLAGLLVGLAVVSTSGGFGSVPGLLPSSGNFHAGVGVVSTSTTATNSNTANLTLFTSAKSVTPMFSPSLASVAEQPLLSDAVILVPVLVAFLLGAILYRASVRDKENPGNE